MGFNYRTTLAFSLTATALLGGCATKSYVREQVGALEQRQNVRMDAIDRTAQDALARATAAGKLAEGKFVYSVALSDDGFLFPPGTTELAPQAKARLSELAQRLIAENRNVYLEIQGHTDSIGSPQTNYRLGVARAEAAMRHLHDQGIAANRMAMISYGEKAPVATNMTAGGRATNRRITIVVLN